MTTRFSSLPNRADIQLPAEPRAESIQCSFEGIEGKRISLLSAERLPASTAITVQYNDTMFLGEVVACAHNCDDTWHLEVKVEQILTSLQSLMMLRERFFSKNVAASTNSRPGSDFLVSEALSAALTVDS